MLRSALIAVTVAASLSATYAFACEGDCPCARKAAAAKKAATDAKPEAKKDAAKPADTKTAPATDKAADKLKQGTLEREMFERLVAGSNECRECTEKCVEK